MKIKYLSHILTKKISVYGGKASINIESIKSISRGDSSNVFSFTLQNHWGTHVDAPNHFFIDGKKIADYPAEFWFFKSPQVVKIDLKPDEFIVCDDWIKDINSDTDILLFKSGWSNKKEKKIYYKHNPGVHPEVGIYLRKNFPNLKAVGIDWISISSYQNRNLGREAHRSFLDPEGENNPIMIIEDMDLEENLTGLVNILILPIRIIDLDSAPCTVIGIFE
jgi:arylformamidase